MHWQMHRDVGDYLLLNVLLVDSGNESEGENGRGPGTAPESPFVSLATEAV